MRHYLHFHHYQQHLTEVTKMPYKYQKGDEVPENKKNRVIFHDDAYEEEFIDKTDVKPNPLEDQVGGNHFDAGFGDGRHFDRDGLHRQGVPRGTLRPAAAALRPDLQPGGAADACSAAGPVRIR